MFNNYYFLKCLAKEVKEVVLGMELVECFSQNKDELIIGLCKGHQEFWIRASLVPNLNLLTFPKSFNRSKKNNIDLFKELVGKSIVGVTEYKNERIFSIDFEEEHKLFFKMFGNRSNLLLSKDNEIISLFQNRHEDDWNLDLMNLNRSLDQSFEAFEEGGIKKTYPTLGREGLNYLKENGFESKSISEQWTALQNLIQEFEDGNFYISNWQNIDQLLLFKTGDIQFESKSALEVANEFYFHFSRKYFIERERQPVLKVLQAKLKRARSYIKKNQAKYDELHQNARHDQIADIIMANLHQIPARSKKVKLFDFYRDEEISIKLNDTLTPQKNAENYYRKSKNQKIEENILFDNVVKKEEEVEGIERHIERIEAFESVKEFKKYLKAQKLQNIQEKEMPLPYKRFEFEGYEILVGKNAANNDILTQRFARKNDLWLHARDVGGSHVVVKQIPGKTFPNHVIEKAASLAAYYSQRKTDTLCPVIYTPKKFVRKPKGFAPGQVVVDKEKVVMIEPSPF
ncbi:NFACT RNA binding domain-containing protein [Sediminitomix flava]|uniref:Putative ribosome quality control (RQC) complex YloA/Tae2 family protein n=1 Tax=Sediminitomix flava TaxID=379075 RepID=A0A315ZFC9_SEDFL|nr:NFACT RNA binding domain-containing protein [Sediminitomix flava]PWJ44296.1 putative ribosome quality control (RQC) complex YloA/Tae2 family protein [Sediminitomix flava]